VLETLQVLERTVKNSTSDLDLGSTAFAHHRSTHLSSKVDLVLLEEQPSLTSFRVKLKLMESPRLRLLRAPIRSQARCTIRPTLDSRVDLQSTRTLRWTPLRPSWPSLRHKRRFDRTRLQERRVVKSRSRQIWAFTRLGPLQSMIVGQSLRRVIGWRRLWLSRSRRNSTVSKWWVSRLFIFAVSTQT